MTDSSTNYHAIPTTEDVYSNIHEARVSGADPEEELYLTGETGAINKWTYFLLGCAIMLPFSALTNGTPFFLSRLADTAYYSTFTSYLSSVYNSTKLFSMFYCTFTSKQASLSRRIFVSIVTMALLIVSLCLSTFVRASPSTFFSFAMFNTASLAFLSGYLCTAVFAQAALLGPSLLQRVITGQGGIAVAVSAVHVISAIVSLWALSGNLKPIVSMLMKTDEGGYQPEEMAARIFFGASALFLCATLVTYTWLTRQASYKLAISAMKQKCNIEDADEFTVLVTNDRRTVPATANSSVFGVLKRNLVFLFSITYAYGVTLAVYPAITARIRPVNPAIPPLLFTAVHFLVLGTGDFIGRQTCTFPRLAVWSDKKILVMSLLRTVFIPLILLCNVYRPGTASPAPPIINSDILFMTILFTMGYTNGFVACLALLAVSSLERNPRLEGRREDVDVAARLGSTSMMVGLAFGALFSFSVDTIM